VKEAVAYSARRGASLRHNASLWAGIAAPWLACLGLLWAGWGVRDLVHTLPGYGDAIEIVWATNWYDTALRTGQNFHLFPLAFYPLGWRMETFAEAPSLMLSLVPLVRSGGAAFAYNVFTLLTFLLAFGGGLALARRFWSGMPATVFALLWTFWGFRWYQTIGHPNILLGSALMPWFLWCIERAYVSPRRRSAWLVAAGAAWAGMITGTMYFVWIGGLLALCWAAGRLWGRQISFRLAAWSLVVPAAVALALSAPGIIGSAQASAAVGARFDNILGVNYWSASLNSLLVPYVNHPWLGQLARQVYRGAAFEQGVANLGWVAPLAALLGLGLLWRGRRTADSPTPFSEMGKGSGSGEFPMRAGLLLVVVGVILSLGLTLRWDDHQVTWAGLGTLDGWLWQIGHAFKPGFFDAQPPDLLSHAVPLPGLLLTMIVPFLERARVFARYALLAEMGVALLAAAALGRIRLGWARWLLAGLLVFEVIPPRLNSVPFPTPTHPAFEWLRAHPLNNEAVVDLMAAYPGTLVLANRGESVLATAYHGQPTVAGASSVWPAHTVYLNDWLSSHPHAFARTDFIPLLRFYHVRYILLHMQGPDEPAILAEAKTNPDVREIGCFDPPPGPGPWAHPICILEAAIQAKADTNLMFGEGWSGREDWGLWAEGTTGHAEWAAMTKGDYRLSLSAFPQCVPGKEQDLHVEVNGQEVAAHHWTNCDPWSVDVTIPANLVRVGGNEIVTRAGYAVRPADILNSGSSDTRLLSMGYTRLTVTPGGQ
jgi:hypothetical protein